MSFKTSVSDYAKRLELAVEHIRENPGISQRQTCQIYGVARSTLQARLQGRQSTQTYHASTQRLSSNEEQVLITWIERMTSWGWPPRIQQFEYMVKELLMAKGDKASLGDHYYQKFLKRHSEFSTKWKRNLDQVRKDAEQPAIFRHWFDLFLSIRTKHGIADEDIYNMDEKGFAMGIADSAKVIIKRGTMPFNVHAGNRDWVSLIECVSGCGRILPAYIIFPGKRIQDDWLDAITDGSITLQVSPNGWTDADIAVHWLKTVFHYHTKHSKGQFRLLLLDGHTSHISIEFIKFCEQMKIIALCLPPHSTHLLQPLDVGVFSPLNKTYKKLVSANSRYGAMNVTKIEFLDHIQKARKQAMMTTNVMGGWRGAGLIPYDPQHVLSKLLTPPDVAVASISTPTTPTTVRRIQDAGNALLNRMTPSLRTHVELLQNAALIAHADKTVLQRTNEELIAKQTQKRQKASKKGYGQAKVLTVDEGLAMRKEKQAKQEALMREKERYHALNGKMKFAKAVWKEFRMEKDVFE